jgi:hypothetical protein
VHSKLRGTGPWPGCPVVGNVAATFPRRPVHWADFPPSTETIWPVTNDTWSEVRKTIALAISSSAPARPIGMPAISPAFLSALPVKRLYMSVLVISLVLSIGGVSLFPDYAKRLLPPSIVTRKLRGRAPTIGLAVGYNTANKSLLLHRVLANIENVVPPTPLDQ